MISAFVEAELIQTTEDPLRLFSGGVPTKVASLFRFEVSDAVLHLKLCIRRYKPYVLMSAVVGPRILFASSRYIPRPLSTKRSLKLMLLADESGRNSCG